MIHLKPEEISSIIRQQIEGYEITAKSEEIGHVLQVGDGIARIYGLKDCMYNELLLFENGVSGMAMNLEEDSIGCVLLGTDEGISEGSEVKRTYQTASVPVGEVLIGRVVNPLGEPLDGRGEIRTNKRRPVEFLAPGVIDRKSVNKPLQTGILAIDSMIPIGRGQRELIIGDRQTGKTAIAIDTIINQKGEDVICIYVAIGQKASNIASIVDVLERHGAMDYSIIVSSTASDMSTLQYLAPYAGCAMAEDLMYDGHKDVLIVYDDLSKHAVAYREMALLLRRPPGREAYPGDVFYLHSRLLERAAKLSDELGGGSITALPIIETLAGDLSAYIPTNVISITDGQIYLETELFFSGQRPAINIGLSVSRVGGAAQVPAIKKVAAPLRINLAQYRELAIFAQFGSDLDKSTQEMLTQGDRLLATLKQAQYSPLSIEEQFIILYAATRKCLLDIPVKDVSQFNKDLCIFIKDKYPEMVETIKSTGELTPRAREMLRQGIDEFKKRRAIPLGDDLSAE
ncbi:MAG TPA: F0F1 ATP synthase subunit alpha [Firmicutes bacterium]|nr:F0F1 ATP synthase subunit alpha [Bacillota bacterium]